MSSPPEDRIKTDSHRFKPNSCAAFMEEHSNPLQFLHRKEATSRHRGATTSLRSELSENMSLLSPAYLLFVEQHPSHDGVLDRYGRRLKSLLDASVSQSSAFLPLRFHGDYRAPQTRHCASLLRCERIPPQKNCRSLGVFEPELALKFQRVVSH